jgi:NTE family protein
MFILAFLALTGCASREMNAPLESSQLDSRYDLDHRLPDNDDDIFVLLAFSGGGTRAASLAYGVLEELRDTPVNRNGKTTRLLDQVDVITAVSGGAYTASYYGLFGDRIFEDFTSEFLYQDWPLIYRSMLVSPINVGNMLAKDYNRTDLMADHLNRTLFKGSKFSDLSKNNLPFVFISATDLNNSVIFPFIQSQFDFLCSDLSSYPVANAVMASSAVIPAFAPAALRNHDGCPERKKAWVEKALKEKNIASRRYAVARALDRYAPPREMPYLRLVDGGVVDNLGVRGSMMSPVAHHGDVASMAGAFTLRELEKVQNVLVVIVNAQVYRPYEWALGGEEPGLLDTTKASFDGAFNTLNIETIGQAKEEFLQWGERVNRSRDPDRQPVKVHFSVITFDGIDDEEERRKYNRFPNAGLDVEEVDRLRSLGAELLTRSPEYNDFLKAINSQ